MTAVARRPEPPAPSPTATPTGGAVAAYRPHVPTWGRDLVGILTWASMLVVVALWVGGGNVQDLTGWGTGLTAVGRLTGLVASDLLLIQVLLMARIPLVERVYGQDELARRHRLVGFWSVNLMVAHIVVVTVGYAVQARTNVFAEAWDLVVDYPGILLAVAGAALLLLVAVTSIRKARRKLRYESWHLLHLYAYLGVGLALPHQLWAGQEFMSSTVGVASTGGRSGAPPRARSWSGGSAFRSTAPCSHRLRVVDVVRESDEVVSVVMTGRRLRPAARRRRAVLRLAVPRRAGLDPRPPVLALGGTHRRHAADHRQGPGRRQPGYRARAARHAGRHRGSLRPPPRRRPHPTQGAPARRRHRRHPAARPARGAPAGRGRRHAGLPRLARGRPHPQGRDRGPRRRSRRPGLLRRRPSGRGPALLAAPGGGRGCPTRTRCASWYPTSPTTTSTSAVRTAGWTPAERALLAAGVPGDAIHLERFSW